MFDILTVPNVISAIACAAALAMLAFVIWTINKTDKQSQERRARENDRSTTVEFRRLVSELIQCTDNLETEFMGMGMELSMDMIRAALQIKWDMMYQMHHGARNLEKLDFDNRRDFIVTLTVSIRSHPDMVTGENVTKAIKDLHLKNGQWVCHHYPSLVKHVEHQQRELANGA
jgi:hypothetical protein